MLNITTYRTIDKRKYNYGDLSIRIPSEPLKYMSQLNSSFNERPLKNNSQNLSFKGLSFKETNSADKKERHTISPTLIMLGTIAALGFGLRLAPSYKKSGTYKINDVKKFIDKYVGSASSELIDSLKNSKLKQVTKLLQFEGENVTVYKKTIPQLIWDGMVYPFKILPGDLANGFIGLLGKIKPLKAWSQRILHKPMFKNIRQRSKMDAKVNSFRGLIDLQNRLESRLSKGEITEEQLKNLVLQTKMKTFDTSKGNYDTKHERTLVRLVSGLPPAIFLANDAYNLSRILDDDPKSAQKEKRTRFNQETARIGLNAYITLVTMGALQKYINNSKFGNFLLTAATTLFAESTSRLLNGKYITRMTPEQARRDNLIHNAPEAAIKPAELPKKNINFKGDISGHEKDEPQKPLLSFDILLKASAMVIAGGYSIKAARKLSPQLDNVMRNFFKHVSEKYKNLTDIKNYTMPKKEFDNMIKRLEESGQTKLVDDFKTIADKYKAFDNAGNEVIDLGGKSKKIKPLIKFVVAPFKFVWNAVTLPYNLTENLVKIVSRKSVKPKTTADIAKEISNNTYKTFSKSVERIAKEINKTNFADEVSVNKFRSFVNDNINKGFNIDTMSNVPNCELSNIAKVAGSAATLWFLMTDNYNMVMLKSNGNDVDGANTKFKERFVQEVSRLFYQTLLIDLFNSTFSSQYHKSFFGVTWITLTNTTISEWLTRKSVGVPVGTHSRQELIKLEEKQDNATGFLKGYYNFMKRLTGKRSIKSYNVKKEDITRLKSDSSSNNVTFQSGNVNFTNNSAVFRQIINK